MMPGSEIKSKPIPKKKVWAYGRFIYRQATITFRYELNYSPLEDEIYKKFRPPS